MKRDTLNAFLFLLILVSVISCSGSAGKSKEPAAVKSDSLPDAMPARRLIEVLAPADNSTIACNEKIIFSVTRAAGQSNIDSVQVWVDGIRRATLTALPATLELEGDGSPGRVSLRAVAFSPSAKPQTCLLYTSLSPRH